MKYEQKFGRGFRPGRIDPATFIVDDPFEDEDHIEDHKHRYAYSRGEDFVTIRDTFIGVGPTRENPSWTFPLKIYPQGIAIFVDDRVLSTLPALSQKEALRFFFPFFEGKVEQTIELVRDPSVCGHFVRGKVLSRALPYEVEYEEIQDPKQLPSALKLLVG